MYHPLLQLLQEMGTSVSSLDLHSLTAELWHNVDQRCGAAEARCAAIVTAQAAAAQHSLEAMRLGLQGLQQEVGVQRCTCSHFLQCLPTRTLPLTCCWLMQAVKLAVSEEHRATAMLGAINARADALQQQVDALEAIVQEALVPAQAMQVEGRARGAKLQLCWGILGKPCSLLSKKHVAAQTEVAEKGD